ncbi:preprotein translocase subunit YajC [Anaerosalibacter bizertensis]|uniref:Preprotein translocase subunit YajC n=1 Tax=Anaerosalibacter bizertensis TaxID=932217 RepID=A0A844FJ52_9FIRM|nr:preprotein translocase subunit YajC [Anaerosalibacter bizertensis]MBV1817442.1 preprotein translocase subunit YajC [Bacteroidales bacterium MSK.15.36]HHV27770.1 preprotein translocase subunit YajC [Tissierellia bacterium]MBU5293404.1 preprotein translocase subunit YajC [Anaerosalibacter bizertensis]MCB5559258.1 preprotein translocase subunit YajC [Anaerosalibacter bizertensis]MCG4564046.1 preprotein translocase subunit YajC [Anaerosalibacter bizertensis]
MPANIQGLILPIAFLVIFYFLAIRPQQKREKQVREMREALRAGDKIITIGGIYGKVVKVKEDIVTVEVGPDKVKFDITKWAVGSVVNKKPVKKDSTEKKDEK